MSSFEPENVIKKICAMCFILSSSLVNFKLNMVPLSYFYDDMIPKVSSKHIFEYHQHVLLRSSDFRIRVEDFCRTFFLLSSTLHLRLC